jgi:hypothetical protein
MVTRRAASGWGVPHPRLATPLVRTHVLLSRLMARPREPDFTRAIGQSVAVAALAGATMVAGLALDSSAVVAAGSVLALYGLMRVLYLKDLERRQLTFERQWLAGQTRVLRDTEFEVVRFTVGRRAYDIADGAETARLFADLTERPENTVVSVDFVYSSSNLGHTRGRLADVRFRPVAGARPRVRYPSADYFLEASGRHTLWRLGGDAVVTLAEPADPGAVRGGTGRPGPPTSAPPTAGRP